MNLNDKNYILKKMKGGYNLINDYYNINKIKILGENIYTLNEIIGSYYQMYQTNIDLILYY